MNKNVQLLNKVLNEGVYGIDDSKIDIIEESIYQELDAMIYEEVRGTLRNTILESNLPNDEKIEKISQIEEAVITKEHAEQYLYENVYPILEVSGINRFRGDNPVFVDGPVLETAIILDFAKRGKFRTLKNLLEDHEEIFNDYSGKNPRNKEDILETSFQNAFKHWGIKSTKEKKRIISEANKHLRESGIHNLIWNPEQVGILLSEETLPTSTGDESIDKRHQEVNDLRKRAAELLAQARKSEPVVAGRLQDRAAELDKEASILVQQPYTGVSPEHGKAVARAIRMDAWNQAGRESAEDERRRKQQAEPTAEKTGILQNIWSTLSKWGGEAMNKASEIGTRIKNAAMSKTGAIVIGVTLLGLIAAYIWKRRNDKCRGLSGEQHKRCQRAAADAAMAGVRAQLRNCPKSANPSKCKADAQRVLASWQARKNAI